MVDLRALLRDDVGGGALSLLTGDEFSRLLRTFEHTAFRLEVGDSYNAPREIESVSTGRPVRTVKSAWRAISFP